jgi:hypothetical protein
VAVTRTVDLALDDHTVYSSVVAMMAVDEERQNCRDEEEDAVPDCVRCVPQNRRRNLHDAKSPGSLEHGTLPVYVQPIAVARHSEEPQVGVVRARPAPVRAVGVGDASQLINSRDECAKEQQVDEGDKVGRVSSARI